MDQTQNYQIFQIRDPTSLGNRRLWGSSRESRKRWQQVHPAMIPINPHISLHHATYQLYYENKVPLNFFEKIYYMNRIVHKRYSLHILEPSGLTSFMPVQLTDSFDTTLLRYRRDQESCREKRGSEESTTIRKWRGRKPKNLPSPQPIFTISFGNERDPDPDHIETIIDIQYDFYRILMIIALVTLKIVHSSHRITREMAIILLIASLYHILLFTYIMLYYIRRQADHHVVGLFNRFYRDVTVIDQDFSIYASKVNKWLERNIKWVYDTLIRKPITGLVDKMISGFFTSK
jgi:hypothetical protein